MKRILMLAVALALASGLLAGCSGGGEDSPFDGTWNVAEYGVKVEIDGDRYVISNQAQTIGSGTFSHEGEYPDFDIEIEFEGNTLESPATAHFTDPQHFEGCYQGDCLLFEKI